MSIRVFKWINTNAKGLRKVVSKLPFNQINVETITANKTLVNTDKQNQHLIPSGASYDVTMPSTNIESGDYFVIKNCADYNSEYCLIIKQNTQIIDLIFTNNAKSFIYDGTNWTSNQGSEGSAYLITENTALGAKSGAYNNGVAIGYDSLSSVVNGFAKGNHSETYRYGEEVRFRAADGLTVHSYCMYTGRTNDENAWIEIFLDGIGGSERWKLWSQTANSVNFKIMITGNICGGIGWYTCAYNIIGHVRKNGASTELKYDSVTELYSDILGGGARVTGTGGDLILEVKGVSIGGTAYVYWSAVIEAIEYRCP